MKNALEKKNNIGNKLNDININEHYNIELKNKICKILDANYESAYGIFCDIPFQNNEHSLKVLVTNNHILSLPFLDTNDKKH